MKRILALLVMAVTLTGAAFAAELYPAAVTESQSGDFRRIEKVYTMEDRADPAIIPTTDFEREGFHYSLLDLLREEHRATETAAHTETVIVNSDTKDMTVILEKLDTTMDYATEDGFAGVLTLDPKSIIVDAAGYKTSYKTVTASRTYPGLSDADTALIPKTIEENGRTLELIDMSWQTVAGSNDALPATYTATVTYSGSASNKYATGYTVTASYTGELTRTVDGGTTYTAIFTGVPVAAPTPEPTAHAIPFWMLPALLGVLILCGGGYGIYRIAKHHRNGRYHA